MYLTIAIHNTGFSHLQAKLSSPLHPRQFYRHRQFTVFATTATPQGQQPNHTNTTANVHIRPVSSSDYWAVADMHCSAFYPRAGDFWGPVLRLDRVMALQLGKHISIRMMYTPNRVTIFSCFLFE